MLPDELLFAIFSSPLLDLNELLWLRLVNKRFNSLVRRVKITKLAVKIDKDNHFYWSFQERKEYYYFSLFKFINEPISSSVAFRAYRNRFLARKSTVKLMLSRLRQLSIDQLDFGDRLIGRNFLNPLSKLRELESLQIWFLKMHNSSIGVRKISLPTVRLLSIVAFDSYGQKLRVDAPKLTKLAFFALHLGLPKIHLLELTHSELLEEIQTDCYVYDLAKYGNLKTISFSTEKMSGVSSIERIFIDFPKLESVYFKLVKLDPLLDRMYFPFFEGHVLKERIGQLIRHRRKRRNLGVEIFLMDFKVENQRDLDDLFGESDELDVNTQLVLNNYGKLASVITAFRKLNYTELAKHFGNLIPSDFSERFVNIREVLLDETEGGKLDERIFLDFIGECQALNVLEIKHVDLDPSFYCRLDLHCSRLIVLRIELKKQTKQPDMSFVLRHKHLKELSINRTLVFALIERFFMDLKSFKKLKFEMKSKPVEIYRPMFAVGSFKISNKALNSNEKEEFMEALQEVFALAGLN